MDDATLAVVIGDNIRRYRERANLTQGQLAEQAGVGTAFISRVERGEKMMKLKTLYVALQTSCEKFSYNLQKRNGA